MNICKELISIFLHNLAPTHGVEIRNPFTFSDFWYNELQYLVKKSRLTSYQIKRPSIANTIAIPLKRVTKDKNIIEKLSNRSIHALLSNFKIVAQITQTEDITFTRRFDIRSNAIHIKSFGPRSPGKISDELRSIW
ncbi:hypothetical protein BTO06_11590 [Tenacibaculum sp. SZ-18]|uniref:hypothetical protein n=1 Tax=Tenacibaculum sp. SZ-18 TaxID=754423 RepID=UPI000C2D1B36|nr:hypothetical protein [Tenacibaculum sp. SZ-18]AUC15752.1 hypothetical protein BTO06_11590 [Tenacibaculum sp. SZ-18]